LNTQVLIIGGGVTGTGLARDLALRGVDCILTEKRDINAGASGGNHGLLHSGARYIESDPAAAVECRKEGRLLKKLASHCVEQTGGLFVAVAGDDENYIADFESMCRKCGIAATPVEVSEARELEPALSEDLIAAYSVADATIDPFRLSLENIAHAQQLGTRLLRHTQLVGFDTSHTRITRARLKDWTTGRTLFVEADVFVNATGAWAGKIARLAGESIPMVYSKGTMLVTKDRLAGNVINRMRKASDGDILVPGGTVSIIGTTSERVQSPDVIYPEVHEVDSIIDEGAEMVPALATTRFIRAYCGVRPLIKNDEAGDDRSVSRGFELIDHSEKGGRVDNLITITGGKLTTFRLMAERAANQVCRHLKVTKPCSTQKMPLPNTVAARWTEPGLAPNIWIRQQKPEDKLLCECEMVPQSVVEEIVASVKRQGGETRLQSIGLRSRVGKGPCQGTFCSQRVVAHLYNHNHLSGDKGPAELRNFLRERWRGQHPLLWDASLAQAELMEAMHCGFFGLELVRTEDPFIEPGQY
jgi:glycerol-3-phosphate dehydrogenase